MDDINKLCKDAARWLPPIEPHYKRIIYNFINSISQEEKFTTTLLNIYVKNIYPYIEVLGLSSKPRKEDCAASGILFFYGCLFYIMHFPNWGNHIEDIFLYNILYILVDHYIDDINVDSHTKNKVIDQMYILVDNPKKHETMKLIDPCLKVISIIYDKLLTKCPNIKPYIIKLFQAEIDGLLIQNNPSHNRETYYNIACLKGGYTMLVLQAIVGNNDPYIRRATFDLGVIIQLIDDSQDILIDTEKSIHTIATYDSATTSFLDNLWADIINRILNINGYFNIFKVLFMFVMMYLPDKNPSTYSQKLRVETNKFNLFDRFIGNKSIDYLLVKNISKCISPI